jgi:hypothetical protein
LKKGRKCSLERHLEPITLRINNKSSFQSGFNDFGTQLRVEDKSRALQRRAKIDDAIGNIGATESSDDKTQRGPTGFGVVTTLRERSGCALTDFAKRIQFMRQVK